MTTPANPNTEPHDPMLAHELRSKTSIEGLDVGEELVCIIRRHPIGLLMLYLGAIVSMLSVGFAGYFLLGQFTTEEERSSVIAGISVLLLFLAMFVGIGLVIATYVYEHNKLIITNKNVTQILQRSLFSRKVSELSMSNVEDVSADKTGILQTVFNYGVLRIQTAGELENFMFIYCPRPNYYGRIILDARQKYADAAHGSRSHDLNG